MLMQFTAEVPKVNPTPVPSKPMPVSGQLNNCVRVCVRFFVGGLAAVSRYVKNLICSSCPLRQQRWQRLWLSPTRLRSKPWASSQVATAAAECLCWLFWLGGLSYLGGLSEVQRPRAATRLSPQPGSSSPKLKKHSSKCFQFLRVTAR